MHKAEIRTYVPGWSAGYCYFALMPGGRTVKIGSSLNPEVRVRVQGLQLLGYIKGGAKLESELHLRFREHRIPQLGEYYRYEPIKDEIAELLTRAVADRP